MMDLSKTTEPRSDQQNYDDVATSPRTVTVTEVRGGSAEQPVEIHLAEFPGRPYKPSKSMRRVLVAAWGTDGSQYVGRRITIYGDPDVKFGGERVGGIKISHLSHIDKPLSIPLTVTRGKRSPHTVQPLVESPSVTVDDIAACDDIDTLREWWQAHPEHRPQIEARRTELTAAAVAGGDELPLDDPA